MTKSLSRFGSSLAGATAAFGFAIVGSLSLSSTAQAGVYGPDECRPGYVWREARPGDTVCVTPAERERVRRENGRAGKNVQPGGGAYGPQTCRNGLVWREAFAGDTVCVSPRERRRAKMNNQEKDDRYKF